VTFDLTVVFICYRPDLWLHIVRVQIKTTICGGHQRPEERSRRGRARSWLQSQLREATSLHIRTVWSRLPQGCSQCQVSVHL